MRVGISELSIIPMRQEPSERSEMVSQVLFGEEFEIIEKKGNWSYIRMFHDNYCGWIDNKMYLEICEERLSNNNFIYTSDVMNLVIRKDDWGDKIIPLGSRLPFFNSEINQLSIGETLYELKTDTKKQISHINLRENIIRYAFMYYNSPYLWGGRTPYGIDCSGLSQMIYKLVGIDIPRDASQQVNLGTSLSFVAEAQKGDLAFFGDEEGRITHVGIIWDNNKIIHASGKVRVDNIDQEGIFNIDIHRYTHKLRVIKTII